MQVSAAKRTPSIAFMNCPNAEPPVTAKTHKEKASLDLVPASTIPENHLGEVMVIGIFQIERG